LQKKSQEEGRAVKENEIKKVTKKIEWIKENRELRRERNKG